ncbi:MAG: hypothetical protein MZU97_05865 [Bacillus subtilis]|nr:hypothetical protein [Bacillus subtilis]
MKDQNEVTTRYPRLDSPFVHVKRKALRYTIEEAGMRLVLDFQTNERTMIRKKPPDDSRTFRKSSALAD